MRALPFVTLSLLALGLGACSRGDSPQPGAAATALAASAKAPAKGARVTEAPRDSNIIDFLGSSEDCSFGHRGVFLDLGDPTTRSRMAGTKLATPDLDVREHEGASWVGVRSRSVELSFVSVSELKSDLGVIVQARVRGGLAKSAAVYLNGKPIGTLPLTKNETTIVETHAQGVVAKGTNDLLLRFIGGGKAPHEQLAEIDWIRVGANDGDSPYAAPARADVITSVAIGKPDDKGRRDTNAPAKRAISLRSPGFARCSAFIPNGAMLEGFVGVTGSGAAYGSIGSRPEAEAEVRVLVDRAEPRVIGSFHLGGPNDAPGWRPISLPLGDVGTIASVELVAKQSSKGARVAFAEARVVPGTLPTMSRPDTKAPEPPSARGVILVVMGSWSRRLLALHGGTIQLPELANLAKSDGVIFDAHRATSGWATGAIGSMLTGLSPREHGAADGESALSPSVVTIAEAARQAGIVTAMFTANPTTSAPFGFARGWETFVAKLPGEEPNATSVFEEAGAWLEAHKNERYFLVIHARGGHPPWDVTSEELKELPPTNYTGSLEPKHSGEALAKARKASAGRMFADADRERAFALHGKAVVAHDAALGALGARVKTIGRDKDTVWLITGDVGVDAAAHVPFLEEESLEEGALAVPLIMHAPDRSLRERVPTATSGVDVAPTILEAFGLAPPSRLRGESLFSIASGRTASPERPLIAETATRLSARWGSFAVIGAKGREVKVCNLSLDPDCVSDVRPSHPFAAEVLHTLAWAELVSKGPPAASDPKGATRSTEPPHVLPDAETATALRVWGR